MIASKSSRRSPNARTAASSTRVTASSGLARGTARRPGRARRRAARSWPRAARHRRRCRRPRGRRRRSRTSPAAGRAAAPACRDRTRCRTARTACSTASRSAGRRVERHQGRNRSAAAQRRRPRPAWSASPGPRPDRRLPSRRASRCARPTMTAVSSRSRRSRVARGRPTRERVQRLAHGPAGRRTRARKPGVSALPRRSATDAPCRVQQILRQIAAVERGQILRPVLQMVQHLQRRCRARPRADASPPGLRRAGRARAARPASPNSGNTRTARPSSRSAAWSRPGGRRPAGRSRMPRRDAGLGEASPQHGRARRSGLALAEQHRLHHVEPMHLVLRRQHRTVGDVVGVAGEGVERMHMRPQARRDQRRADRESSRRPGPCPTSSRPCRWRRRSRRPPPRRRRGPSTRRRGPGDGRAPSRSSPPCRTRRSAAAAAPHSGERR